MFPVVIAQTPLLPVNPNTAPLPLPGGGVINDIANPSGVTTAAADALTNLVAQSWDQTWTSVFSGPLYGVLSRLGLLIAGFTVIFFVFQFARNMLEDSGNRPLSELIWPLVVVIFLSNNGGLLSGLTMGMRGFINQQNSQILQTTTAGLQAQSALNRISNFQSAQAQLASLQSTCDDIRDNAELQTCLNGVKQQADQILAAAPIQEIGGVWLQKLQTMVQSVVANPLQAIGNGATVTGSMVLRAQMTPVIAFAQAILMASQGAFQTLIEVAFLLTGLLGPIALGASLLPFGPKPIWAWLTSFWSVGLCKLCLNIITGIVAQASYGIGPTDALGLNLPITLGVLSPILAIAMASGGGMAIFNGLTSAATTIVSIASYGLIKSK
jgi:hypothetical protein